MGASKRIWLLFFPAAALLVFHAAGVIAPYRDSGEFVLAARFLNVPHPPGYPFYALLARLWTELIPFGTTAYRLNILSAFAAALAFPAGIFFLTRYFQVSFTAAFISMSLFLFSNPVLGLSAVSEMYTVGLLLLILILICTHEGLRDPRYWLLAAMLAPLALGTRMDLALSENRSNNSSSRLKLSKSLLILAENAGMRLCLLSRLCSSCSTAA